MAHLPRNLDWLHISIALRPAARHEFRLAIVFCNQSAANVVLPFSNAARKAEFFGLSISDRNGCRVEPTRNIHIRPVGNDLGTHEIAPHGDWEYVLEGLMKNSTLHFPGADYLLQPQTIYQVQFQYQNVISNVINWKAPVSLNASVRVVERQMQMVNAAGSDEA